MKTKLITLANGLVLVAHADYEPPTLEYKKFPDCCGAGEGWQQEIVPDSLFGICFSPACHIHDDCYDKGEATWADFHQSNGMFFRNILAIIKHVGNILNYFPALIAAGDYFLAVDTVGAIVYEHLHGELT